MEVEVQLRIISVELNLCDPYNLPCFVALFIHLGFIYFVPIEGVLTLHSAASDPTYLAQGVADSSPSSVLATRSAKLPTDDL